MVRMDAILRKMVRMAEYLPGQILPGESHTEYFSTVGVGRESEHNTIRTFYPTRISSLRGP